MADYEIKNIQDLVQRTTVLGTERIPVSEFEYVTIDQIIGGSKQLSPNGFVKFPSGLMIQWGTANITKSTIIFPTAFTLFYSIVSTTREDSADNIVQCCKVTSASLTTFTAEVCFAQMGQTGLATGAGVPCSWIAIGTWK